MTSGRHGYTAGTAAAPHRHLSMSAGHGFVFRAADGTYRMEHCVDGHWGACTVAPAGATDRQIMLACLRHDNRRPHLQQHMPSLAGVAHAPYPEP